MQRRARVPAQIPPRTRAGPRQNPLPKTPKTARFRPNFTVAKTFFLCSRTFFAKNPKTGLLASEGRVCAALDFSTPMPPEELAINPRGRARRPPSAVRRKGAVAPASRRAGQGTRVAAEGNGRGGARKGVVGRGSGIDGTGNGIVGGGSGIVSPGTGTVGKRSGIVSVRSGIVGTGSDTVSGRSDIVFEKYRTLHRLLLTVSRRKHLLAD